MIGIFILYCSAGVGRSGTILTIAHCLQKLNKRGVVDICSFVQHMRQQRNYMVRTERQYIFIHYAILEVITNGDTSYSIKKFMRSYMEMSKQLTTRKGGRFFVEDEFNKLGMLKTIFSKSSFQSRIIIKGAPLNPIFHPTYLAYFLFYFFFFFFFSLTFSLWSYSCLPLSFQYFFFFSNCFPYNPHYHPCPIPVSLILIPPPPPPPPPPLFPSNRSWR